MDGSPLLAIEMRPVPYEDDRYAEFQLERCRHDQNTFDQALTIISIVAAATVFFQRIRHTEHRRFPDNIFTVSLITLCGLHLALLLSIASQNKVVLESTQPWRALCQIQGRMFHWCSCAGIWNVVCVIVILHRVIVRKTAVHDLLQYSRMYYYTLIGLPSVAVVVCSIFGGYGPYPGLHNCWIEPGAGRLLYFHLFTVVAFLTFLVLGPPTVVALWRAYHHAAQPTNAGMFRSIMWRQILLAGYGLAVVMAFLLGGLNNVLINTHKHSAYVKNSVYPLCIFSAVNFASLGLSVSVIYWSTRHQTSVWRAALRKIVQLVRCGGRRCGKDDDGNHNRNCDQEGIDMVCRQHKESEATSKLASRQAPLAVSSLNLSPHSPLIREDDLRSAFDSGGRSVISIPPDPKHRAAHHIANNAYTSTLLEYVREQLLEEAADGDSDSDFSSDYDDSDECVGRRSLASETSADDQVCPWDSSHPTSPQSFFHEIPPHDVPSDTCQVPAEPHHARRNRGRDHHRNAIITKL